MPPKTAPHIALTDAVNAALARGEPQYINQPATTTIAMSFDPDGSIEFTRNKSLDAFFGGRGTMKRVTDIKKLPDSSLFYIQWLMGPYCDRAHDIEKHIAVFGNKAVAWDCRVDDNAGTLLFFSYEAAVHYEIICLNEMREQGVVFDHDKASA